MLNSFFKKDKNGKERIINQKLKFRNNKQLNIPKSKTVLKQNKKERINLVGPTTNEFMYNMEKRKKLNSLKEKSHRVSGFMTTLGESFKSFNRNLNSEINPLMIKNLTNISFKRSLFIRQKLRNIDKMNKEFDKEYNNPIDLYGNTYKYNDIDLKEIDEEQEERIKKEKTIRDDHFRTESMKILNILYNKNSEEIIISDYKKNKKLNELKSSIDYICGVEIKGQNGNTQNDPNKIPHYSEQIKSPSFIREKSKNASFTPSVKYNKSKVYYSKKYELSQEKMDKSKRYIENINSTIQISPNKKIKYIMKGRNNFCKTEANKNNSPIYINSMSESKETNNEESNKNNSPSSFDINDNNQEYNSKLPQIKLKDNDNNIFKTIINIKNRKNNLFTFSPKQRYITLEPNIIVPRKYNFSPQDFKHRCKTANNITHFRNDTKNRNKSNRKKFFPLLRNLLNDNYNLKNDLKFGFNIINNMINDFKKVPKKKDVKNELNIEKIRKELKLNNSNNVIDEVDVVMNNVKKMEKLVKKKDVFFLRNIAKTVLREDKLANKNLLFDNNSLNAKLKKLCERKNKNNIQDESEVNLDQQERIEMIRLFKNDGPDFFNEDYLSSLIKRYKTMNVK